MKIAEQLCRFFCDLIEWQLKEKSVLLKIDDADDPAFFGFVMKGTIYTVVGSVPSTVQGSSVSSNNSSVIIHLDSPMNFKNQKAEWLIPRPRHIGFGLDRLCLSSIAAYIHALEGPNPPEQLVWDDIIAICSMKLSK